MGAGEEEKEREREAETRTAQEVLKLGSKRKKLLEARSLLGNLLKSECKCQAVRVVWRRDKKASRPLTTRAVSVHLGHS